MKHLLPLLLLPITLLANNSKQPQCAICIPNLPISFAELDTMRNNQILNYFTAKSYRKLSNIQLNQLDHYEKTIINLIGQAYSLLINATQTQDKPDPYSQVKDLLSLKDDILPQLDQTLSEFLEEFKPIMDSVKESHKQNFPL